MMTAMLFSFLVLSLMNFVHSVDIVPYYRQRSLVKGQHLHFVDPWIVPPNITTWQAANRPGFFASFPTIVAFPTERITFVMRDVFRGPAVPQMRHGVYLNTNRTLVTDYLNNVTMDPCGPPIFTSTAQCLALTSTNGLNTTDCPFRLTLFPLVEYFGSPGTLEYTTPELGPLAALYGVPTKHGSHVLVFDCPNLYVRPPAVNVPGPGSHCSVGHYVVVEVMGRNNEGGKKGGKKSAKSGKKEGDSDSGKKTRILHKKAD